MYKKALIKFLLLIVSIIVIYSQNSFAASDLVGGITINNGDAKTTKQDVNLTITAGNPTSVTKTETSQTDFNKGTLSKTISTSDGSLQLDKFLDGGFESGNFNTWDRNDGWQIVTNPIASGKYAAKANGSTKVLMKNFPSLQKNGYFRSKVRFTEANILHYIFVGCGAGGGNTLVAAGADGHFCYHDVSWKHFPQDKTYTANTWYTVEVYWFGDSNTYKVVIDGMDVTNGGIWLRSWEGNIMNGLYNFYMSNNAAGNVGGMIIDDVFVTTNITPVMDEGFESGDFSKWDRASQDMQFITDTKFSGKNAVKGIPDSLDLLVRHTPISNKGYFKTKMMFLNNSGLTIYFCENPSDKFYCVLTRDSSGHLAYTNGYNQYFPIDTICTTNIWYTLEIYWDNSTQAFKLLIDGKDITNGGLSLAYTPINDIDIYIGAGGVVLDDVLILDMDKTPNASTNVTTYSFSGTRTSPAIDLSSVNTAVSSNIDWNATTPTGTAVTVDISLDDGSTWQAVTKGGAIPGITSGMSMRGKSLLVRQTLSTTNMEVTPILQDITITVNGVKPSLNIVQMMISNDSRFTGASWQPYATSKSWQLTPGDGSKTVYIKFKDSTGESDVYSDNITLGFAVTLNDVYDEVKIRPAFRIVCGKDFRQVLYGQLEGQDPTNSVAATLVSVSGTDFKYTILTGKFNDSGDKAIVINGTLILFDVISQPTINDVASVSFE